MRTRSIKKTVVARELPSTWPERDEFAPEDRVTVWIEPEDAELERATTLAQLMDLISARAQARGLTQRKLKALLNDT
jgi:hypothetical protein